MTAGGCLRRRTSTGSLDSIHITWSIQAFEEQHSESEQSTKPSVNWGKKKVEVSFILFLASTCVVVVVEGNQKTPQVKSG